MNDPRDPWGRLLLAAVAAFAAARSVLLVYPDLNLSYPFLFADSYDWIANGLAWEGWPVDFSVRPPVMPLVVAGLDAAGLLPLFPIVGQCALVLLIALNHALLAPRFGRGAAAFVTLLLAVNFFLQNLSLHVLADLPATLLILAGCACYLRAGGDDRWYAASSLLLTLSLLCQYAAVAVVPALVLHWALRRRTIRPATLLCAAVPPALLLGGWALYRLAIGTTMHPTALVAPHADSFFFYLLNTAAVLGLPAFCLLIAGLAAAPRAREAGTRDFLLLNALLAASWAAFWVIFFTWNDRRFVVYLVFFLVPFIAHAFRGALRWAGRRGPAARAAVAALAVAAAAGSYLPYETSLTCDTLALTRTLAVRFPSSKTPNVKVSIAPSRLVRRRSGASPLDLGHLAALRRGVDGAALARLAEVKAALDRKPPGPLCVRHESTNRFAWYTDKNKFGNFLRRRLLRGPGCGATDLEIVNGIAALPRGPAEGGGDE